MSSARSDVVSSFTIIKGSLIAETYEILAAWDESATKKDNLERVRAGEVIRGAENWLRDVAKVVNRRFDATRDHALMRLAKNRCPLEVWKPIFLWHITRDEFLLRDFLINFVHPLYASGTHRVDANEASAFLDGVAGRGGRTEHAWTPPTKSRVAVGLLRIATDFGLLTGTVHREFTSYHLPDDAFLYLLHALVA